MEQTQIAPAVAQGCRVQPVTYVAGFMFSETFEKVALIRKNKPDWQRGKLNGIGGKREKTDAHPRAAMTREFEEETGLKTFGDWRAFCALEGPDFTVDFFVRIGDLDMLCTMEEEPIEIVDVASINPLRTDMIENLPWLIALAIDCLTDGRPSFVVANYP